MLFWFSIFAIGFLISAVKHGEKASKPYFDGAEVGNFVNFNLSIKLIFAFQNGTSLVGGTIVTDSITSSGLKEFIENELNAKHYRYRRGYKNVIDKAVELCNAGEIAPLAIETSGHAAFRSNYFLDDGAYLVTRIVIKLAELRKEGKTISDLISALREPVERKEIRFNITESDFRPVGERVIAELEAFAAAHEGWHIADDNREGIRVSCDEANGWFLLRLSVHDPVMPMNFESDDVGGVQKMINSLTEFFKNQSGLDITTFK